MDTDKNKLSQVNRIDQWGNKYDLVKGGDQEYDQLAANGYLSKNSAGFNYIQYNLTGKGGEALKSK